MISNHGFMREELEALRAKNLYRELRYLQPLSGTTATLDGKTVILFCGNDYLGLSWQREVIERAKQVLDECGTGAGAARLISGSSQYHQQLEEKIAALKKKEKALVFSAGYLANLGALSALAGPNDLIVMDKLCHASLIDGAKLSGAEIRVFPHLNYDRCDALLSQAKEGQKRILVSDSVFSMDGDLADLPRLIDLKKKYGALLLIDDAHATGVLGAHGRGAAEDGSLEEGIDLFTGTLSKALGVLGGFAAGSESLIQYLVNKARSFIFATALPPSLCASAIEALRIIESDPDFRLRLWRNVDKLNTHLFAMKLLPTPSPSPIFPMIVGEESRALELSRALLKRGFLIPAVRYPTVPKGKARLRITLSALHSDEQLDALITALRELVLK